MIFIFILFLKAFISITDIVFLQFWSYFETS